MPKSCASICTDVSAPAPASRARSGFTVMPGTLDLPVFIVIILLVLMLANPPP